MWTAENRVGRLIEGRIETMRTREEAVAYAAEFHRLIRLVGELVIVCADFRPVGVFSPPVADELQKLMESTNKLIVRSAALVSPDHATNAMQVERVVRSSGSDLRRRFVDRHELQAWLGESLTPPERARLAAFLDS